MTCVNQIQNPITSMTLFFPNHCFNHEVYIHSTWKVMYMVSACLSTGPFIHVNYDWQSLLSFQNTRMMCETGSLGGELGGHNERDNSLQCVYWGSQNKC